MMNRRNGYLATASAVALVLALGSCVIGKRSLTLPSNEQATVVVGSSALSEPLDGIARHPWIGLREAGGEEWERWEVMCCPDSSPHSTVKQSNLSPLSDYGGGGRDVRLHGVWTGKRAERAIACVREKAPQYPHRNRYLAWPGPNSNTFVDHLMRACGLHASLPAPSIGKDYRGLIGASFTSGGTGIQIETPLVGVRIGLKEGIELHLFSFAVGIDFWPPALIVPIGPGRIGFDDR